MQQHGIKTITADAIYRTMERIQRIVGENQRKGVMLEQGWYQSDGSQHYMYSSEARASDAWIYGKYQYDVIENRSKKKIRLGFNTMKYGVQINVTCLYGENI